MTLSTTVCNLMLFFLIGQARPEQQPQTSHVKGRVVAFHPKWRFPAAVPAFGSMALPTDLWIVRIDSGATYPHYVLAKYEIYKTPLSEVDIKKELQLEGALLPAQGSENPCQQMLTAVRTKSKSDFVFLVSSVRDVLPAVEQMPCLVVEKPPVVLEGGR
jgi:hypothetical protein